MGRILVAGIGNIFLGDDGFGPEVVRHLATETLGDDVAVADFGIRGVHLAYELADEQYAAAILVDAAPRGDVPGTLYVIDPAVDSAEWPDEAPDAHTLTPASVLAWLKRIGSACPVRIVACEPECLDEQMGLSATVTAAIPGAVQLVRDQIARMTGAEPCA
jgi:hydrogenase maturation protease